MHMVIIQATVVQDFTLGNKLFIVCEYMPYSLLQLLEGAAEPPDPSSNTPPPGQLLQHGLSRQPCATMLPYTSWCSPTELMQVCLTVL